MAKALLVRAATENEWLAENPILDEGEIIAISFLFRNGE